MILTIKPHLPNNENLKKFNIFSKSREFQNKITLIANHLLVLYAFLAPIYDRAISTIVAVLIVLFIVRRNYIYYLKEALSNKIVQAFLLFVFMHLLWLIGADNLLHAKEGLKNLKYYLYPLLILVFMDKKFVPRIITGFIFGMLASESVSYMIHFDILPHQLNLFNTIIYTAQKLDNPSPFINHSAYNTFLSITVGILLYNLLANQNRLILKLISIFFICTASVNLILVGGRIGYLTFVIVILATLFFVYKKKFLKIALPVALIGISAFFYIAYNHSPLFQKRIDATLYDKNQILKEDTNYNTAVGLRIGFWIYSYEVIKDNFFFGVGVGEDTYAVRAIVPKQHEYLKHNIYHPHNEYLKQFLQFGIFGLLVFLYIFYTIFKAKIDNPTVKYVLYIVTIALAMALMTDVFIKNTLFIFVLFVSVCSSKAEYLEKESLNINKKTILAYILFIFISIIIVMLQK